MSIDGARDGVPPQLALEMVLTGKPPDNQFTKQQMLDTVLAVPADYSEIKNYEDGCYWLARQFYLLRKDGIEGGPHEMYVAMKNKCGESDYDFTGFMVGWANNCSRWLMDLKEVENPAILEVRGFGDNV